MAFNKIFESTAPVSGVASNMLYFRDTILDVWINSLPHATVSAVSNDRRVEFQRVAMNSNAEATETLFCDFTTDYSSYTVRIEPDPLLQGAASSFTHQVIEFDELASVVTGSTGGPITWSLWQSDADPRSWFLLANNWFVGMDLGDKIYKYTPTSNVNSQQYYSPFARATNSGISTYMQAWGVGDYAAGYGGSSQIDPINMKGMYNRAPEENYYSTDVITAGFSSSNDINITCLGVKADVRQVREGASYAFFGIAIISYFDGTNYWIKSSYGGMLFNVGTTDPGF